MTRCEHGWGDGVACPACDAFASLYAEIADLRRKLEDARKDAAPWMLWDGTYEKEFYDVWVKEPHSNPPRGNDVVLACWPNAGKMVSTDGTGRKWNVEQVRAIRVSEWQAGPPEPPAAAIDSAMKDE